MCVTYNLKHYTLQLIQNYNELHFLGLFPPDMITKTVRGVCIGHFTTCNLKLTETFMCFFPPSAWKSCDYTVSWEDLIVLKDAFERWGKKSISIFEKSAHNVQIPFEFQRRQAGWTYCAIISYYHTDQHAMLFIHLPPTIPLPQSNDIHSQFNRLLTHKPPSVDLQYMQDLQNFFNPSLY